MLQSKFLWQISISSDHSSELSSPRPNNRAHLQTITADVPELRIVRVQCGEAEEVRRCVELKSREWNSCRRRADGPNLQRLTSDQKGHMRTRLALAYIPHVFSTSFQHRLTPKTTTDVQRMIYMFFHLY